MTRWGIGTSERAWSHSFRKGSWVEIREILGGMAADHPDFGYLVDVVDSVIDSGADQLLAGATSMHDLMVVLRPIGAPVRDTVRARHE